MTLPPLFISICGLVLLHLRERSRDYHDDPAKQERPQTTLSKRIPPDPRVLRCCEEELAERPKYVLDLGSGFGDRARFLAEKLRCTVVAFESNPGVSFRAAEETKDKRLVDSVWHVRCDEQLSVDAQDVIEQQYYDAVVISTSFARRRGALAWAALALREGGVMIVEGDWKVYDIMRDELGLEHVRVCSGGTLESLEGPRNWLRDRIARNDRRAEVESFVHGVYHTDPYFLICGVRIASQAPLTVRPRTLSAITFTPSTPRTRLNSTLFEKPVVIRRKDERGRRMRVGCICVCASSSNPHRPDFRQVVIISSSKRPGEWIVPAGGLEENETPDSAATREAYEESGSEGRVIASLGPQEDALKHSITQFYLILVHSFEEDFPEKANRRVALVDIEDAIRYVSSAGTSAALRAAHSRFA